MNYIYAMTCLYLLFLASSMETKNLRSAFVFKVPPALGALVYGILTAKGFGLI